MTDVNKEEFEEEYRDDTKILAVTQIVSSIINSEYAFNNLMYNNGGFVDPNEIVVKEALAIYQLIEDNV